MFEIFLAVCALTALDCDSVYVRYGNTGGFDNIAIAGIGESGAYHIVLRRAVAKKPEHYKKKILVHEVAHLVVLDGDSTNTTHNEEYQMVCHALAEAANVRNHKEVCDSHTGTQSVWQSRRRRE